MKLRTKPSAVRRQKSSATPSRGRANRADPGSAFCAAVAAALQNGEPQAISDLTLRRVLTAAVKLYAAKCEQAEQELAPFEANAVTATETVVACSAMIRAADLNLFDVAMWFGRPPANL